MAFVSRKRVGCNERKAVDQELCETGGGSGGGDERGAEEEQAGRVVSRGGRGGGEESEARLQRRLVRGRLEQGRRRRRRRAEEGDAAFCEAFCDEMGPAVLLPRNEHPEMRIASTPCGVFLLSRRVHDNCQSTELSISGRKYQLRQNSDLQTTAAQTFNR